MNVTILLINGDPEIHATGCRDIARRKAHCSHLGRWTAEAATYTEIAVEFACDFIDEGSMTQDEAVQWVLAGVKPCAQGLPIEAEFSPIPGRPANPGESEDEYIERTTHENNVTETAYRPHGSME